MQLDRIFRRRPFELRVNGQLTASFEEEAAAVARDSRIIHMPYAVESE